MAGELTSTRGDSMTILVNFTDDAGDPIDITGWKLYLTIKKVKTADDDDAEVSKEVTAHVDAVNGQSKFELSAADTLDLLGKHYYDVQYKKPDGKIGTIVNSTIRFSTDITRRVD